MLVSIPLNNNNNLFHTSYIFLRGRYTDGLFSAYYNNILFKEPILNNIYYSKTCLNYL